ncbi:hypothetical protein K402DRAFT_395982 [Aulographum hederae CBS 113979]|uniref:Heterokaryon incompatibility domain-containing protein n=1 Tax=Aulographum hederae CBS 113979 TaxID=1176131 RepID=A0A6G1GTD8_9PEZI|nr:hypothetical protein K402DRAFT_395982 [Aulographum hederae CBS 113979]
MPSWVPDWSQDPGLTSLGLANTFLEPYDAGGSVACGLQIYRERLLSCLGIRFDVLSTFGQTCPELDMRKKPEKGIGYALNQWYETAREIDQPKDHPSSIFANPNLRKPISYDKTNFTHSDPMFTTNRLSFPLSDEYLWSTILALPSPTLHLDHRERTRRRTGSHSTDWDGLKFCLGRKLLVTARGFLGLAPPEAQKGDVVVVLLGAPTPLLLRKRGENYVLVGECYVHGIMGGEALGHLGRELEGMGARCRPCADSMSDAPLERFVIV